MNLIIIYKNAIPMLWWLNTTSRGPLPHKTKIAIYGYGRDATSVAFLHTMQQTFTAL